MHNCIIVGEQFFTFSDISQRHKDNSAQRSEKKLKFKMKTDNNEYEHLKIPNYEIHHLAFVYQVCN